MDSLTMDETIQIAEQAMKTKKRLQHVVVNVAKLVNMQKDKGLCEDVSESDIVNIDVTVIKDEYHGDSSIMVQVGDVAPHAQRLIEITQECLYLALDQVKPGATLGDIGCVIQQHAEKNYYSVVREYSGHGIGKVFHEDPQVLHYGRKGTGMVLEPGMTFTIEPMINAGRRHTRLNKKDGWTVTTRDGRLSAQWEHTLCVTDDGCEVFTRRNNEPELG